MVWAKAVSEPSTVCPGVRKSKAGRFADHSPQSSFVVVLRPRARTVAGLNGLRGKKTRKRRVQRLALLAPVEIENEGRGRGRERREGEDSPSPYEQGFLA